MLDTCHPADHDEAVHLMDTTADADSPAAETLPADTLDSLQDSSSDPYDDFGVAALVAAGLRNLEKD